MHAAEEAEDAGLYHSYCKFYSWNVEFSMDFCLKFHESFLFLRLFLLCFWITGKKVKEKKPKGKRRGKFVFLNKLEKRI